MEEGSGANIYTEHVNEVCICGTPQHDSIIHTSSSSAERKHNGQFSRSGMRETGGSAVSFFSSLSPRENDRRGRTHSIFPPRIYCCLKRETFFFIRICGEESEVHLTLFPCKQLKRMRGKK